MLLITCPHCGPRAEVEFRSGGEAHIARPAAPESETDAAWRDYLFTRQSPRGIHFERWNHAHGCQRWFNAARDTVTDEILAVYRVGEEPPADLRARRAAEA
jgi:heterotetrameric sarcosine oxidase delta subunit